MLRISGDRWTNQLAPSGARQKTYICENLTHVMKPDRNPEHLSAGMSAALEAARRAASRGDIPIGASLAVNGVIVASRGNRLYSNKNWCSHAEQRVVAEHSALIRSAVKRADSVELFTTLEPCIMCMGAAVMHRLTRVTFGLRDPDAGWADPPTRGSGWYRARWPAIAVERAASASSRDLLTAFCKTRPDWAPFGETLSRARRAA